IATADREHRPWCATSKGVGEGFHPPRARAGTWTDLRAIYRYRPTRPVASVALDGLLRVDQAPEGHADQGDAHVGGENRVPLGAAGVSQASPPIREVAEEDLREDRTDAADHVHQAEQGPEVPTADLGGTGPPSGELELHAQAGHRDEDRSQHRRVG